MVLPEFSWDYHPHTGAGYAVFIVMTHNPLLFQVMGLLDAAELAKVSVSPLLMPDLSGETLVLNGG